MINFTPGPWQVTRNNHGPVHIRHIEDTVSIVCSFSKNEAQQFHPNKEANARLIAAAPELYEALCNMVKFKNPSLETIADAQKAIAKAEGKE